MLSLSRRSNCTFMELKFRLKPVTGNHKEFKLYLYGIEMTEEIHLPEHRPVQIVPLWN